MGTSNGEPEYLLSNAAHPLWALKLLVNKKSGDDVRSYRVLVHTR